MALPRRRRATAREAAVASLRLGFALLALALSSGCATYSEKFAEVRTDTERGAFPEAIEKVNGMLGVSSAADLPGSWKGDRPLLALERGVLLQATSEFRWSAQDLSGAETELEMLDISKDAVGTIGKYFYSDSAANYHASPTERISLNGLNMANYLALGDLGGAAVEARRYTDMRDYLASIQLENNGAFGAYLAGFVFERSGEGDRALRYYEEALAAGKLETLAAPVARLAGANPYRGPRIEALLSTAGGAQRKIASPPTEILVVLALGRVPHKEPKRIPIGAAVGIAGTFISGDTDVLKYSVFKVVTYPELVSSSSRARAATVRVDGSSTPVEEVSNLGSDIRKEYDQLKPRILAAALTRMIARAALAEGARAAGKQAGNGLGSIVGTLSALAAEGSLVALDKPDTRSWTLLADRILVARTAVTPGDHRVLVGIPGVDESRSIPVTVQEGGFAVVVVTVPR